MTKSEIAGKVAQDTGIGVGQASDVVDAIFGAIAVTLAGGDEVAVSGFGKFGVTHRAARSGRNPANGETIQIAASNNAKFSAGSALKKRLNA